MFDSSERTLAAATRRLRALRPLGSGSNVPGAGASPLKQPTTLAHVLSPAARYGASDCENEPPALAPPCTPAAARAARQSALELERTRALELATLRSSLQSSHAALASARAEVQALQSAQWEAALASDEQLRYIAQLQAEAVKLRASSGSTGAMTDWLDEALRAGAEARSDALEARTQAAQAVAEAAAREAECHDLQARLKDAGDAAKELTAELAAVWAQHAPLRQASGEGVLADANARAAKYKALARELHGRLRRLTLAQGEELAAVRQQLRTAYQVASAATCAATPLGSTPALLTQSGDCLTFK